MTAMIVVVAASVGVASPVHLMACGLAVWVLATLVVPPGSPWLTAREAAARLRISPTTLYAEVAAGRLRAARIGGRKNLRFLPEWCDAYLEAMSTPVDVSPSTRRRA